MTSLTQTEGQAKELRQWASGASHCEAFVDIILGYRDGQFADVALQWIAGARDTGEREADIVEYAPWVSGGEARLLRFAQALIVKTEINLSDLQLVDRECAALIVAAIGKANGYTLSLAVVSS